MQYYPLSIYTVMQYPARARVRSIPVFHVDIQLYAIESTRPRHRLDVHEKVMEITTMWGSLRLAPSIAYGVLCCRDCTAAACTIIIRVSLHDAD